MQRIAFSNPFEKTKTKGRWMLLLFVGVLFAIAYILSLKQMQYPSSDISIHATWASEFDFARPKTIFRHVAHPMWHLIVAILLKVGLPLNIAAALVTAVCKALQGYLVYRLIKQCFQKMSTAVVILIAGICVFVSGLFVPGLNPRVYLVDTKDTLFTIGTPNTWHSCTQYLAQIFMLIGIPYTAYLYDTFENGLRSGIDDSNITIKQGIILGLILAVSLLGKPTFMQAFLPAACLFFLASWIRHPKNYKFYLRVLLFVLPSILMMCGQYVFYFTSAVLKQGGVALTFSWSKIKVLMLSVVLMRLFPWSVYCFERKQPLNTLEKMTILFDAVAVVENLLLGETGTRAADGNFGWAMMGAALMLWVTASIRFVASLKVPCEGARDKLRCNGHHLTEGLLLLWHLYSGIYYLYLLITRPIWL